MYLIESVVGDHHICKRVQSPTICKVLQLTREGRNDCCVPSGVGLLRLFVGQLALQLVPRPNNKANPG